ncbi:MAG TPA: class I SAM-dependent methyltransferase [Candidatus Dormibacteraeota bacterium]|nr:class I SAM-dependent methyltransferase [Candidatus Dormibacteraeota bacterium]
MTSATVVSVPMIWILLPLALLAGILLVLRADLRRRRLALTHSAGWGALSALDVVCPAVTTGWIVGWTMVLVQLAFRQKAIPLNSPAIWALIASVAIGLFTWSEGQRQVDFQRPNGLVLGEWLILTGACLSLGSAVFGKALGLPDGRAVTILSVLAIAAGAMLVAVIVPPFVKRNEGHHILERVNELGESVQNEYVPATSECPHPERWRMADSQTAELEVLDFLKSLVTTVKPQLIVETGTFIGYSAIKMAEGLKANGFGRIITIEYDPAIFAKAKERIDASGLGSWIEYRNESSLETRIDGAIDILFSDSDLKIREQEIRRFLPQLDPNGLIVVHDASSHFQVVREATLRLEREGLISTVLLPTPRGLVIAQKHEGRR